MRIVMQLERKELPYIENVASLFAAFAASPWAVLLDSGRPQSSHGRYDIFSAFPRTTLVTRGAQTLLSKQNERQRVPQDPFKLLEDELPNLSHSWDDLPFVGGAMGYFSYDLGRRIERLPSLAEDDIQMPDMAVGIYHWAYIADHVNKTANLVGNLADPRVRLNWDDLIEQFSQTKNSEAETEDYFAISSIQSNMTEQEYKQQFAKVKGYIAAGDCYQVNLAQRFTAQVQGSPWQGYQKLRQINPAPFAAFMNVEEVAVLSASPERFLQVREQCVETKPIKGTRPRGADAVEDQRQADELANSLKDRAENLMIVDLLRNDLSKSCQRNSVSVPKLFEIESFPTVHHLVSTVTGRLPQEQSPVQLLKSCFPGGSITGAPKIRAMEIIEELEPHRRGLYCGSIGYLGFDGQMDTNIAIRTVLQKQDQVYFYAGGGLVWDSEADAEYQETFDKAAAMIDFLKKA